MPIARIQILEGRSIEQIETLIAEVTQAISRSVNAPVDTVRVLIEEVPKTHWGIGGQTAKGRGR